MSDFWARKLAEMGGVPPRPQQPQRGGLGPDGTPWWASRTYSPTHENQQPAQTWEQQQGPKPDVVTVQDQQQYMPRRAPGSAKVDTTCPGCGGGHYYKATPSTQAHCFTCGYQDRCRQSMSGVAMVSDNQAAIRPSLYQAKGSGYRPDVIVGKV